MKKWTAKTNDLKMVETLSNELGISSLCANVLISRGINSSEKALDFVNPKEIENPFVMADMQKAVDTINESIDNNKKICIFGDYDCDGITSTAILKTYLEFLGANVITYIPERSEGYGMNINAIDFIYQQGTDLIITVDNGISAHIEAEHIYELGMKLVITDHHQPSETLPKAEAVVNPHRKDCPSSFKDLCGAGVVFKLVMALEGGDYDSVLQQFGDLVAIATIGDIVNLSGENRKLVIDGLHYVKHSDRIGLLALAEVSSFDLETVNSIDIAFKIVPRINASGRFGSPKIALELLTAEDNDIALDLAKQLFDLNNQRKRTEEDIMEILENQILKNPKMLNERVLVFYGENLHHGVIGIVASKFVEKYDKPCFIITNDGEKSARGSARGIGKFSIFECLTYCSDILEKFGGHTGAGGFSLNIENVQTFRELILKFADEKFLIMSHTEYSIDKVITLKDIFFENVKNLKLLEPFGEGNHEPIFLIPNVIPKMIVPLSNNTSVKFKVIYMNKYIDIIKFRTSVENENLLINEDNNEKIKYDFLVKLSVNSYNGRECVTITAVDYRLHDANQMKYFSALDIYEKFSLGKELSKPYIEKITPSRDDLKIVYSYIVNNNPVTIDNLFLLINNPNINFCKLKICLDIFSELDLISIDTKLELVNFIPNKQKVDLNSSVILQRLKSLC